MKAKLIIFTLLCFFTLSSLGASSADMVLKESAAKIKAAKGVDASFKLTMGGRSVTGTLKSSGNKFAISTSAGSSWYNGKAMWTYNPSSGETTVVTPTAAELAEVNPLVYLNSYSTNYTASFSKNKIQGQTTIILTPKKKRNAIKQVEIAIGGNKLPSSIKITSSDGSASVVTISKLNLGSTIASSEFEYPKAKFPKAEIVDLR